MVDLMHNLQDVYAKWEARANPPVLYNAKKPIPGSRTTTSTISSQSKKIASPVSPASATGPQWAAALRTHRETRKRSMPLHTLGSKLSSLGHFKTAPIIMPENAAVRPFMGSCCMRCLPLSRKSSVADALTHGLGMRNMLQINTWAGHGGIFSSRFNYLSHVLRTKVDFHYPDLMPVVLHHERVRASVENETIQELEELGGEERRYGMLIRKHERRAVEILQGMQAKLSKFMIRLAAWVLFKLLGRLLTSIQINKGQIEMLKKAHKASIPMIYLPLHRSHLDYILISFILYNNKIKAPLVAAGDNLRIFLFGSLMRSLGAFFIKRKLDPKKGKKDLVYRSVLHTYMEQLLKHDHSLEFFVEGGRSRNGKACLPKGGLLSVIVDALVDGVIDDAYIIPVGISYEKLLDGHFISEQLGKPKKMENFLLAVRSIWKVFHSKYGSVRVDFAQPYSLKEFVQAAQVFSNAKSRSPPIGNHLNGHHTIRRLPSSSSLYGTDIVLEDQRNLVKGLAEHIVYDAVHSTAIMSTNLLAFLMLHRYRKGVMLEEIVQSYDVLRKEILNRHRDIGFTGESIDAIRHASRLLGEKLILVENIKMAGSLVNNNIEVMFMKPNLIYPHVLEIAYYSNAVLSVFLLDSIVANAMFAILEEKPEELQGLEGEIVISQQQLLEKALDLCDIVQYEFIISPPCIPLELAISETIQQFITQEIFSVHLELYSRPHHKAWASSVSDRFGCYEDDSSSEDDSTVDTQLSVHCSLDIIQRLRFYRHLLSPFIEGYWQIGLGLQRLVQNEMEEQAFIRLTLASMKERASQGFVIFVECMTAETVKNGLKLFESWKVIESYQQESVKVLYLGEHFNSEERISTILELLEEFKP